MEGKVLIPVWESVDLVTSHPNSLPDSRDSRRALRRNRSDSTILEKDVPSTDVQGRTDDRSLYVCTPSCC